MIRAFLSFIGEDLDLVNMFRGQARNDNSDLEFADYSIKEAFNSTNADYIKRGILDQIRPASITICLYGPQTYTSNWVDWELQKSIELGKPVMGVWLYNDGRIHYYPAALDGRPRVPWNVASIVATMRGLVG